MSSSRLQALRAHVRAGCENRPGVYRMLGPSGEVLYVGKSVHVRTRLLSYFRAERGEKANEIIGHAHEVQWEYAPSEFAALLLEFRHIKQWRPPYNVEHKRDKGYCFVRLSREAVPRLTVVSAPGADGAEYYGPLRGRSAAAEAVRALCDLLELRDCAADTPMRLADQLPLFPRAGRKAGEKDPRCMRGQLGRCLSPCAGGCTREEYHARVAQVRAFLEGQSDAPVKQLEERIRAAASRLQFEYAAELRDRAEMLAYVQQRIVELRRTVLDYSFVYTVPGHEGEDRAYVVRRGSVRAELPAPRTAAERRGLADAVDAVFSRPEPHTVGLRAHEAQEIHLVARWFRLHPEELERTERQTLPLPFDAAEAPEEKAGSLGVPLSPGRGSG